jgi:actin beta/gamma 1
MDILRELKEKMCYTVTNYDEALKESEESHANEKTYDLPDGRKVTLGSERFKVAEALFTPTIAGYNMEGLTKYCFDSAMKCDVDVRKELL